ncbi:MAG: spondin domain-containing protein [Myxococcota bacterium]
MNRNIRLTTIFGLGLGLTTVLACGDDDGSSPDAGAVQDTGGSTTPDSGVEADAGAADTGADTDGGAAGSTSFTLRIENVSGAGPLPGPISPGVALAHTDPAPLFTAGAPDRNEGLAAIAEDGDPSALAGAVSGTVVFNTPTGEAMPGPAFPGGVYEVEVMAEPGQSLSFATMLVQTNDVFLAPGEAGIPLFDSSDAPLPERDVTAMVSLWDVGSEANETPGAGPNQAPRQAGPNSGAAEGVVRRFDGPTHALPLPASLIGVDVTEAAGTFTVTLTNTAPTTGVLLSPFSPGVYAVHPSSASIFATGSAASPGTELLAEDGDPATWAAELQAIQGVTAGTFGSGPVMGGDSVSFDATPTAEAPVLSFATMVIATNDAFFALPPSGIALLDGNGAPRPAAEVQAEMRSRLAIWDAGTEIDQIPGVGPDQPQRGGGNVGAVDPNPMVRRHGDTTNLFANLSTILDVTVVNGAAAGSFDVTIQATAEGVANGFPILTPVAWAVHSDATGFFTPGMPASAPIEALAEDGDPSMLAAALGTNAAVGSSGVQGSAPFMPGAAVTFSVSPTMDAPFLSFATMIVPSNDLFLAFGRSGVRLLAQDGTARTDAEIATDIAAALAIWDAGTEQNQSGAGGADQAPRQAGPNTGEAEGDGNVRAVPDGVWTYPTPSESVRVTIRPTN